MVNTKENFANEKRNWNSKVVDQNWTRNGEKAKTAWVNRRQPLNEDTCVKVCVVDGKKRRIVEENSYGSSKFRSIISSRLNVGVREKRYAKYIWFELILFLTNSRRIPPPPPPNTGEMPEKYVRQKEADFNSCNRPSTKSVFSPGGGPNGTSPNWKSSKMAKENMRYMIGTTKAGSIDLNHFGEVDHEQGNSWGFDVPQQKMGGKYLLMFMLKAGKRIMKPVKTIAKIGFSKVWKR